MSKMTFEEVFNKSIQAEVKRVVDNSIEDAKRKLEQELLESVDRIALKISSLYSIEQVGTILRIEVKKFQESES